MNLYCRIQAADYLGISVRTLDRLAERREIAYIQPGKGCRVQYTAKALDDYLTRNTKKVRKERSVA